jgi:hypothetical protein
LWPKFYQEVNAKLKQMKRNQRLPVLIFIAILFASCAQKSFMQSKWQAKEISKDYTNDDAWTSKMHYDTKSKLLYAVSNDQEKLYVRLKVVDKTMQQKMLVTGFSVWIDTTGKNKTRK